MAENAPAARFLLVNAAHHFLTEALPVREPQSQIALDRFLAHVMTSPVGYADLDGLFLRCLGIIDRWTHAAVPSMLERYLASSRAPSDCIAAFSTCAEDAFRRNRVDHPEVHQAVAIAASQYSDPNLSQKRVADAVGLRPSALSEAFRAQIGTTFSDYLRNLRLDRAAEFLRSGNVRVKDVWVCVGYNYATNFNHDFKTRFGVPPTEYRARALGARTAADRGRMPQGDDAVRQPSQSDQTLLIVDDDEGTRETVGLYLRLEGYRVSLAATAREALFEIARIGPDAVLLDYNLPDMSGLECLRTLRRTYGSSGPAVAIFTADWDLDEQLDEIRALDAVVASKVCDLADIKKLIAGLTANADRVQHASE
jgi:AraC-like DNA-binding protein/CheY-like chemotaxis protein